MPVNNSGSYFANPAVGRAHESESLGSSGSKGDSVVGYLRGLSDRIFHWSDADHKQAADYADQRAKELRETQAGPRMAKPDLSGHISELERTAQYHRSQMKSGNSEGTSNATK